MLLLHEIEFNLNIYIYITILVNHITFTLKLLHINLQCYKSKINYYYDYAFTINKE